ncbi:hypothetical protein [Corynebacterium variabile]|uniref:hypothetical protein n=1 Tax=Corynebacterium variabile TaxID=1727 RepID=UPI002FDFFEDE
MTKLGGVAALYGFRYQMLRVMERVLDLHHDDRAGDWAIEVEHATHDSVDYAEYRHGSLVRVVQVKASQPGVSTRLSEPEARNILTGLARSFPAAPEVALEANRQGSWDLIKKWLAKQGSAVGPSLTAWHDSRSMSQAEADILRRIAEARRRDGLPSAPEVQRALAALLEAHLWQLAARDVAARASGRRLFSSPDIEGILGVPDQRLAEALGMVSWSTRWHLPDVRWIQRGDAMSFLELQLAPRDIGSGRVARAVLTGFGGLGKSTCAAAFASAHRNRYAMVIWFEASSSALLEAEVKDLLQHRFGSEKVAAWNGEETRTAFVEWLETTPRTWLLVLDAASDATSLARWIPTRGFGHVLITSRDSAWPTAHAPSFEVGGLTSRELRALVRERLGVIDPAPEDLNRLAGLTDSWALAVDMVLSWLTSTGRSLAQLGDYEHSEVALTLLERPNLLPPGYPAPALTVIVDAVAALQETDLPAWRLLQSVVALGGRAVPTALIAGDLAHPSRPVPDVDILACDGQILELRRRSLVQPGSLADPRLGKYRHRLDVHGLISDIVTLLAPPSDQEWLALVERLNAVVSEHSEAQHIGLVLSMTPVIEAVDSAMLSGRAADVSYLTLLGNTANVWRVAGAPKAAAARLILERVAAEQLAADNPGAAPDIEWFWLLATAHLASVLMEMGDADGAVDMAEEFSDALPRLVDRVKEDAVGRAMETVVDVMSAVRHVHLADRATKVLDRLGRVGVPTHLSPARAVEGALRDEDYARAAQLATEALGTTPRPVERIELLVRLAEALAASDVRRSDALIGEAVVCAKEEGLDPSRLDGLVVNVLHQRLAHMLGQSLWMDEPSLRRFRGWFDVLDLLGGGAGDPLLSAKLAVAQTWRAITVDVSTAEHWSRVLSFALAEAARGRPPEDELVGLQWMVWQTQLTCDALGVADVVEATAMVRAGGHHVIIELDTAGFTAVVAAIGAHGWEATRDVEARRRGVFGFIRVATVGVIVNLMNDDPFERISGAAEVHLVPPGTRGQGDRIDVSLSIPLGETLTMTPDSTAAAARRLLRLRKDSDKLSARASSKVADRTWSTVMR